MRGFLLFVCGVLVGAAGLWFFVIGRAPTPSTVPNKVDEPRPPTEQAINAAPSPAVTTATVAIAPMPPPAPVTTLSPAPVASVALATSASVVAQTVATTPLPPPPGQDLLIPVQGIKAQALMDTFTDARGQGRVHDAIDIMAARGTPVLATADGKVEKLFTSKQGGLTLYQFDPSGSYAYYYAHLDRYADGITQGQPVHRGQVIGYVGSTGNASPDGPHLHFAIFVLGPEKRWWQGTAINPYPLLRGRQ